MSIKSLHKRLDKLGPPGAWYDPTLAAQWNNAAGARASELWSKGKLLTEDEKLELAHLEACSKACNRKHSPSKEWIPWSDPLADHDHTHRLFLDSFWRELTADEHRQVAELKIRPDPNDPLYDILKSFGLKGSDRK